MGYRSDVAYAIVFRTTEDRDKVLSRITPEQQQTIRNEAIIKEDRILFHNQAVKWYTTREMGYYGATGYDAVDAHDTLLTKAQEAEGEYSTSNGTEGVYSMGIFIRLGEEDDDTARDSWGEFDAPEGFPKIWDLVDYSHSLTVGW